MLTYKTEGILYIMRFSLRASDGSASHIPRQVYVFRFTTRQSIMDFLLSAIPCDGIALRTFVSPPKKIDIFLSYLIRDVFFVKQIDSPRKRNREKLPKS